MSFNAQAVLWGRPRRGREAQCGDPWLLGGHGPPGHVQGSEFESVPEDLVIRFNEPEEGTLWSIFSLCFTKPSTTHSKHKQWWRAPIGKGQRGALQASLATHRQEDRCTAKDVSGLEGHDGRRRKGCHILRWVKVVLALVEFKNRFPNSTERLYFIR